MRCNDSFKSTLDYPLLHHQRLVSPTPRQSNIQVPFASLDLPPEIRTKIYTIICTSPKPVSLYTKPGYNLYTMTSSSPPISGSNPYFFPNALHLVSHQIYDEIRPLYFSVNTFWLSLTRHTSELAYFLSPSFLDNRRRIRDLKVLIQRWGGKDYFRDEFAPVIEDMILNGSLRKFEVVLRENFANGVQRRKRSEREDENWVVLKALCNDPYLESVNLKMVDSREIVVGVLPTTEEETDITYLLKMA